MKQVHEYLDPGKEMKFENELGHRVWGGGGAESSSAQSKPQSKRSTANSNGEKSGSKRSRGGHGVDARVRLYGQIAQDSSFGSTGRYKERGRRGQVSEGLTRKSGPET